MTASEDDELRSRVVADTSRGHQVETGLRFPTNYWVHGDTVCSQERARKMDMQARSGSEGSHHNKGNRG